MVTKGLTIYDTIVDLVPGVISLFYLVPFLPATGGYNTLLDYGLITSGIFVLALGYTIGRTIHGISGLNLIETSAKRVAGVVWNEGVDDKHLIFGGRMRYVVNSDSDDGVESHIADNLLNKISNTYGIERSELLKGDEQYDSEIRNPGNNDDLRHIRYMADSALYYDKNTLSWKYGALATFFRNLWLVFLIFGILYLLHGLQLQSTNITVLGVFSIIFSLISVKQRFSYKRKQIRAIMNELYMITNGDSKM